MNLRQKAKYYKKKYMQNKVNYYDRSLFPASTIQTEKIMASAIFREEVLLAAGADADDFIASILVNTMKEDIKRYLKVDNTYYAAEGIYKFYGSVRLVKGAEYDF